MSILRYLIPFEFSNSLDPTQVNTVGDQVIFEHTLGFHLASRPFKGFETYFTKIERSKNLLIFKPAFPITDTRGKIIRLEEICKTLSRQFAGTRHAPLEFHKYEVQCGAKEITVSSELFPLNLNYLFTLPDFGLYSAETNFSKDLQSPTWGPYSIESVSSRQAVLKINPHFPISLRANQASKVSIESYAGRKVDEYFLREATSQPNTFLYLTGFEAIGLDLSTKSILSYRKEIFPSEWALQILQNSKTPPAKRHRSYRDLMRIFSKIDLGSEGYAQRAFSISPSDKPFGLSESEHSEIQADKILEGDSAGTKVRIGVYRPWHQASTLVQELVNELRLSETFEVVLTGPGETRKLFECEKLDGSLWIMGMSADSPSSHLSFLSTVFENNFRGVLERKDVLKASFADETQHNHLIKEIEKTLHRESLVVPWMHAAGIVLTPDRFERDPNLAWNWGVQAWTHRIR